MRYIIFFGADYYPSGGSADIESFADDLALAKARLESNLDTASDDAWCEVFDTETRVSVIIGRVRVFYGGIRKVVMEEVNKAVDAFIITGGTKI